MLDCGGKVVIPGWVVSDAKVWAVLLDWDEGFKAEGLGELGSAGQAGERVLSVLGVLTTGLHRVFLVE